jgi:prephenate dehydrogenase
MVKRIIGYSKSPSTTEQARRLGAIDQAAESALLAVSGSDLVLIAVPVSSTEAIFKAIRHLVEPGALIMDVGSTKRDVVDAARRVLKDRIVSFVPAHPIAGKEVAGIDHADAALFQGRQVILTPLPKTSPELLQKATDAVGGDRLARAAHDAGEPRRRVRRGQPPAAHPRLRLLQLGVAPARGRDYLSLGGPGFRDFTRIAASNPEVWRDILMANREEILKQTQRFRHALDAMEHVVKTGNTDALEALIRSASDARPGWQMNAATPTRIADAGAASRGRSC